MSVSPTAEAKPAAATAQVGALAKAAWWLALLGLAFAIGDAIAGLFSGIGYRLDLWTYRDGIGALRYVFWVAVGAAVVSAFATFCGVSGRHWAAVTAGLVGFAIAATTAYIPWSLRRDAQSVPPIHDISTDTDNPPRYVKVAELRKKDDHPVTYAGAEIADLQRKAYPDIAPILLRSPADKVFAVSKAVLAGMGLEVVDANPAEGRIEATETTLLFGFEDDLVVRIAPQPDGMTRVDVRSKSRVGRSDLGINANRIRIFTVKLRRKFA